MLEHEGLLCLLSLLDSCLQAVEINIILTLTHFSFNSGAPETSFVVIPFYYSITANKYALTTLAELAREFAEAEALKTAIPPLYHTVAENARHMVLCCTSLASRIRYFSMEPFTENMLLWKIKSV